MTKQSTAATTSTVIVRISGLDQPGITAAITAILARHTVKLVDIEQVVTHGRLFLFVSFQYGHDSDAARENTVLKDLLFEAKDLNVDMDFELVQTDTTLIDSQRRQHHLTMIAPTLGARHLHSVAKILVHHEANIDRITRLSNDGVNAIEILTSTPSNATPDSLRNLRHALFEELHPFGVDVALQDGGLRRRAKRLLVMDMDSTLIQMEVIDELARANGCYDKVSAITHRAMEGELDFTESLKARVAALKGLPIERLEAIASNLPLTAGAEKVIKLCQHIGLKTAVISGGFTFATEKLKADLQLDYAYANKLEIIDGKLSGKVLGPIVSPARKADLLDTIAQQENIDASQIVAVGDGANDALMLEHAGLGIAFHAKRALKSSADTSVSSGGLDRILYFLGIRASEVDSISKP